MSLIFIPCKRLIGNGRENMKIHDISITLDENTLIYPGDEGIIFTQLKNAVDNGWNLSSFSMGAHSGSHIDSKKHLGDFEQTVLEIPLDKCYGDCLVLNLTQIPFGNGITEKNFMGFEIKEDDILLIKTKNSSTDYKTFKKDYVYLSESGANYLLKKKIKAFGLDYLSIGPKDVHNLILLNDIIVFENLYLKDLDLKDLNSKRYIFVGFPLKIKLEGAPVRAILIET